MAKKPSLMLSLIFPVFGGVLRYSSLCITVSCVRRRLKKASVISAENPILEFSFDKIKF